MVRSLRLQRLWWGQRGWGVLRPENFRVIQVLEFSFILMFWKQKFFGCRTRKYHIEFKHLFCWRLLRPVDITFLKTGWWNSNVQTFWPPEDTRYHISTKLLILLPLRAIYFSTIQYETPCTTMNFRFKEVFGSSKKLP